MVSDDGDGVHSSLEILTPFLQGHNYCKEFAVIDVVVVLSGGKGARKVCAWM